MILIYAVLFVSFHLSFSDWVCILLLLTVDTRHSVPFHRPWSICFPTFTPPVYQLSPLVSVTSLSDPWPCGRVFFITDISLRSLNIAFLINLVLAYILVVHIRRKEVPVVLIYGKLHPFSSNFTKGPNNYFNVHTS